MALAYDASRVPRSGPLGYRFIGEELGAYAPHVGGRLHSGHPRDQAKIVNVAVLRELLD